jgi:hypothetical protein
MNTQDYLMLAGTLFAVMPHVAAIIGTPAWLSKIDAVEAIFNVLASRYGKDRPSK